MPAILQPTVGAGTGCRLVSSPTSRRTSWTFENPPMFEVRTSCLEGLGLVALRKIAPGERILQESPLLLWEVQHEHISTPHYDKECLPAKLDDIGVQRATYYALSQNQKYGTEKTAHGIWQTNAYPLTSSSAAVFTHASRINHSCRPNTHNDYNAALGQMTVHAAKAIAAGEEITVSYLGHEGSERAVRQRNLRSRFGFKCTCSLCALASEARQCSDTRQREMGVLGRRLASPDGQDDETRLHVPRFALVEKYLALSAKEGLPTTWGRALLFDCARRCRSAGDLAGAYAWAARAAECALLGSGDDCASYLMLKSFLDARAPV